MRLGGRGEERGSWRLGSPGPADDADGVGRPVRARASGDTLSLAGTLLEESEGAQPGFRLPPIMAPQQGCLRLGPGGGQRVWELSDPARDIEQSRARVESRSPSTIPPTSKLRILVK